MTPDQQRETALRLYRLAWRFPEQAPELLEGLGHPYANGVVGAFGQNEEFDSVSARVSASGLAVVDIAVGDSQSLRINGTPGYVETMLRAIPYSLRPHVEVSDGNP